jgi:ABC-type nitrate/sulfonate/bicarbonate transport system substrate-binding protein
MPLTKWFGIRLTCALATALAFSAACSAPAPSAAPTTAPAAAAPKPTTAPAAAAAPTTAPAAAAAPKPTTAAKPSSTLYSPATPEPGSDIPPATVKFGMRPYADNTYFVIGMEKGWFKDVGITIDPQPYGLKTTEEQWVSLLLNRQVDMNSATCSILLTSYKTTDQLKCTGLAVTFYGQAMLANPKLGLKTLKDYVEGGMSFNDALKAALTPLTGKTVYIPPGVAAKEFTETPFRLAGLDLPKYVTQDDPQMLLLGKSERLDFMHPAGAPIAQTMLDAGWTPVYDSGQLLKYGPGGVDSPLEPMVSNNGWAATADYINSHQTTAMRFASVVFRIFDAVQKDSSLYAVFTPYLNSVAGTSLDGDGVRRTVENLDPFVTFDAQSKYFLDKNHPEYYGNSMGALIKSLESSGTIRTGVTADELIWAAPMYLEMLDYKNKSDALFKQAEGKTLAADKQQLLTKARQLYEWFNFLDAYRLATAAVS